MRGQSAGKSAHISRGCRSSGDGVGALAKSHRMRSARGDIDEIATIGVCRQLAVGARGGDGHHLRMRGGEMRRCDRFVAGGAHEEHPIFMMRGDDALKQRAGLIAAEAKINDCGPIVHRLGDAVGDVE